MHVINCRFIILDQREMFKVGHVLVSGTKEAPAGSSKFTASLRHATRLCLKRNKRKSKYKKTSKLSLPFFFFLVEKIECCSVSSGNMNIMRCDSSFASIKILLLPNCISQRHCFALAGNKPQGVNLYKSKNQNFQFKIMHLNIYW